MDHQKILFPYNFTSFDRKALDFVIHTFAGKKEAEITLFNTYTPAPNIEMQGSPVMEKMKDNVYYMKQRVMEQENELKSIKNLLLENGFSTNQIQIAFEPKKKDVAGDIIDFTQVGQFDIVVLNRKPGKIARFFAGSVSSKILATIKNAVVCVVS